MQDDNKINQINDLLDGIGTQEGASIARVFYLKLRENEENIAHSLNISYGQLRDIVSGTLHAKVALTKPGKSFTFTRALKVAAILCVAFVALLGVLMFGAVTVYAHNNDINLFRVLSGDYYTRVEPPSSGAVYDLSGLYLPAWLPDGYEMTGLTTTNRKRNAIIQYENGGSFLTFYVVQAGENADIDNEYTGFEELEINGNRALVGQNQSGTNVLYLLLDIGHGEYASIRIESLFESTNTLIEIAKSVALQ